MYFLEKNLICYLLNRDLKIIFESSTNLRNIRAATTIGNFFHFLWVSLYLSYRFDDLWRLILLSFNSGCSLLIKVLKIVRVYGLL